MELILKAHLFISVIAGVLAISSSAAQQATQTGPNGGLVAGAASHLIELVIKEENVSVYSLEAGKAVAVDKAKMRLVVQQEGKSVARELAPAETTRLAARLDFAPAKGAIIVVSGRDNHGHSVSARFVMPDR